MKKVSVIMPVYNVEKYLRTSVDSVLAQTYLDYELILVDDGSPDNCPAICDEYALKCRNIKVIHKKNGGLSSARNAGVEMAEGKYILFVDSDDTIESELLEKVVPQAEATDADVTIFGINTVVLRGGSVQARKSGDHEPKILKDRSEVEGAFCWLTKNSMWNYPVDKLYKRDVIVTNGVRADSFYDRVCEDTVFLLELFPFINKICIVEGCYYNYAIRDTQSVVMKFIPERYEKYYGRFCKTRELMNALPKECRDEGFLYNLYCTFIVWAYEGMFHKDCRYSIFERYTYIKKLFSIRKETGEFCKKAAAYIKNDELYINASGTTKKALLNILRGKYRTAWIYHVLAFIRGKMRCRN